MPSPKPPRALSRLSPVRALVILCVLAGSVGAAEQPRSAVPEEVLEKARRLGGVRVNVQVRVEAGADRAAIEATKAAVRAEIAGSTHRVIRELRGLPVISIEASYDTLVTLAGSARVLRVEEDGLARPQG
jgi:hypothetical protein